MSIANFFSSPANAAATEKASAVSKPKGNTKIKVTPEVEENPGHITVNIKVEQPDIILVEDMENPFARALVLSVSISSELNGIQILLNSQ